MNDRLPQTGFDDFAALFEPHGGTDLPYLRAHYARFVQTRARLLGHWSAVPGARILDIGAHWLHQALLYATEGFEVAALDLPETFERPEVAALARAHRIRLLPNRDLERPSALASTPDDTFDIVLFTEVIEHLPFNPVAMWREIYRVMRPGARVVLTTPNYYAFRTSLRRWSRAVRMDGGGVAARDVLGLKTLGHHWKEYSMRELREYFRLLSSDFRCVHCAYTEDFGTGYLSKRGGSLVYWIEHLLSPLRPDIYIEAELASKTHGVTLEPHW